MATPEHDECDRNDLPETMAPNDSAIRSGDGRSKSDMHSANGQLVEESSQRESPRVSTMTGDADNPTLNLGRDSHPTSQANPEGETLAFEEKRNAAQPNSDQKTVDFSYTDAGSAARSIESFAQRPSARMPKKVGQYAIDRILGRGGMGIVYKARQETLGRDVALKMVLAGSHASNELLARFIVEAKAVAHLQHPNIVQIFEVGEHEGLPYFSLEFVDGAGLDRQLAGKPLDPQQAARLTITICQAMQYAHDHKVLHRDLKPANILMTSDGVPKVTDFGLAKRLEDNDDSASTRTGTIMGTPSYMSPEQARGAVQELGPATDQYSIGAILYEFLTGRPPFLAPKPVETIMQVLNSEPVPPRQLQPKLPIDIETICLKALQKDAAKRYDSCTALAADLSRFLNNEPILARPVGSTEKLWRWCRRNPLVASLTVAASVALIAVASVSTWSALALTKKNSQLAEKNTQLVQSQEEVTRQSVIAKENESRALEQESIANSRADSIVKVVQAFFKQVISINVEETPSMEGTRDNMLAMLLPMLEGEVLKQNPTDSQARLTRLALLKELAEGYAEQNKKEEAERIYLEAAKEFEERALLKKTDAARNNFAQIIRALGDLKRELYRDMQASLNYHRQHLAIATDIWNNSRADDQGLGKYSEFQRADLLTRANHDLAVTLYRIGKLKEAKEHFAISDKGYKRMLELQGTDPWLLKKSEAERRGIIVRVNTAYSTSQLASATLLYHLGEPSKSESVFRRLHDESKVASERDVTNASLLHKYCGMIGVLGEFLAQQEQLDEALGLMRQGVESSNKLLTFAPGNSEFQRTNALAHYRFCQWGRQVGDPGAEAAGLHALNLRRNRVRLDPKNDRYRVELMLSEAQVGDPAEAQRIADEYQSRDDVDNELLIEIACAKAQVASRSANIAERPQQFELAIAPIQKAVEQEYGDYVYLQSEIDLRPLNDLPEFKAILARIDR